MAAKNNNWNPEKCTFYDMNEKVQGGFIGYLKMS